MCGHLPDHRLGEQTGLARHPDQDRRLDVSHHIEERGRLVDTRPAVHDLGIRCQRALDALQMWVGDQQSPAVENEHPRIDVFGSGAVDHHRILELLGDPEAGRTGTGDHHAIATILGTQPADRRQDSGDDHGSGPLDVVVERGDAMPILHEVGEARPIGEVLPLQKRVRIHLDHSIDELLDERVVLLTPQTRLAVADVQLVIEQFCVVGSNIQRHGNAARRMDACGSRVQRQLADRNPHTPCTLVADTENPLVVGDNDDGGLHRGARSEDVCNPTTIAGGDVDASLTSVDPRPMRTGECNGRGVDDRDRLCEIVRYEPVEERFITVHQSVQIDVLADVGRLEVVLHANSPHLALEKRDLVRKQPGQPEGRSFIPGEGIPLVQKRVPKDRVTSGVDGEILLPGVRVDPNLEGRHGSLSC